MLRMLSMFRRPPKPLLPPGERVYAVGDVHGRLDLLDALLDMIWRDDAARPAAETHVLLLGDMIDRGADSAGVVRRVIAGDARFASLGSLKGNHEASLLAMLDGETQWLDSWLTYGGRAALLSWGVAEDVIDAGDADAIVDAARNAIPAAEQRWLADLPTSRRHGDYLFVHAGIRPGVPLDAQQETDLLWIRDKFLGNRRDHGACIVHGHTISRDPELLPNRIGIDTGAYVSGTLTAVGLDGGDQWFLATGGEVALS
jgi:serine/threonine protein phosphatase 1